ncbi:MAG: hypothetical protein IJK52_04865 [Oscillospiraceae bacterium]|nr:hypothetical protein [Oscillospiraceae bacterium]
MKKRLIQIALILGLITVMCAAAQATGATGAEEPTSGFRVVKAEEGYESDVTLTPVDAKGANVTLGDTRYPGAVKVDITYKKAQDGKEYLLCVLADNADDTPTADNMAYIDQQPAEGNSVKFTAFPKAVDEKTSGVKYTVYLSSNADNADNSTEDPGITAFTKVATFEYYADVAAVMLGDVNGDEDITVNDALDALFLSVGTVNNASRPEEEQREAADVDQSGDVEVQDALNILYCSVGTKTGIKALDDFIDSK